MRYPKRLLHPKYLWDLFVTSDPDLGRLRMGLRSVLGAGLSALIISQLASLLGEPPTVTMVGIMMGMMGSQLATDPSPREQRRTTLLMALPAIAAILLGTLTSHIPLLGAAAFAVTIFIATFVRRFGPRGLALGMIGFFAFFNALYFHAQAAQVPALVGAIVVAICIAYAVRFVLIRDRPRLDLHRFVRSFRKTVGIVLWELTDVPAHPRLTRSLMRRFRREADRLNDAALAVEDLLARCQPALRLRIFDLELATDRVIAAVRQIVESGALAREARKEVRAALVAAHTAVRNGDPAARRLMEEHLEHLRAFVPGAADPEQALADARRFGTSITDLVEAAANLPDEIPRLAPGQTAAPNAPIPKAGTGPATAPPENGFHPSTRQAIQATVASVLAMVVGHAVSPERWYWAVITAFVIFTRTRTLGETLLRGWSRVLGTFLGVIGGVLLAGLVSGHRVVELVSVFVCVFFGFYLIRISYGWMVFWFTMMLSILYSLLGRFTPDLLYLRIEETVIGAGLGMLIATFLFPERTTVYIHATAKQVLSAVSDYLEEAVVNRSTDSDPARLIDSARTLDARLRDLRTAARPLTGPFVRFAPGTARRVHSVSELAVFVRHLAMGKGVLQVHEEVRGLIREAGARLAGNARALAQSLGEDEQPALESAAGLLAKARSSLVGEETLRKGPASPPVLLHWLARVDDTLNVLAKTVGPLPRGPVPQRA
ncbi:FUSC family protein [Archangium lipolyticum]|uniref:FUSC family protein n=1 Tax=Archangium lipolyticum TaxID=2970465 RepID=UPI00214A6D1D|nr:FUSC family protein [Archangium lipolyticum]